MYIGSTKSLKSRKYEHFYQLKKGNHHSMHLQNSYNKYGKDKFAFYILEECSLETRKERELYHINLNKSFERNFGYNIYEPNENNFKCSEETKLKIKNSRKISLNLPSVPVDVYNIDGTFFKSFDSVVECSRNLSFNQHVIHNLINKKRKSFKGYFICKKGEPFIYIFSKMRRDMSKFYK